MLNLWSLKYQNILTLPVISKRESQVNPRFLMDALHAAFLFLKGTSIQAEVMEVSVYAGRVTGLTLNTGGQKSWLQAKKVVLAHGVSTSDIFKDKHALPSLYPIKGQMFAFYSEKKILNHVIRTSDLYLAPKSNGLIICGSTTEPHQSELHIDDEVIDILYNKAVMLYPVLRNLPIEEKWAGIRPASCDGLPVIGPLPIEGVFMACGHYRSGVTQSPLTAKAVMDWLEGCFDREYFKSFLPHGERCTA